MAAHVREFFPSASGEAGEMKGKVNLRLAPPTQALLINVLLPTPCIEEMEPFILAISISWVYVADSVGSWKEILTALKEFISYSEWTLGFEKLSQCNVKGRGDKAKQLPPPTTCNQNNNIHITCILCLSLSTLVFVKSYLILDFSYRRYLK